MAKSDLSMYLPQLGMLSGMMGQPSTSPMANASPQFPSAGSAGQGSIPFMPHLTGPQQPGTSQASAQGGNPLQGLLNNPSQMAALKALFANSSQGSQMPNSIYDKGAMSVADLANQSGSGSGDSWGWLSSLFGGGASE